MPMDYNEIPPLALGILVSWCFPRMNRAFGPQFIDEFFSGALPQAGIERAVGAVTEIQFVDYMRLANV